MSREHPVVEVLRTRHREDSRPGARSDDHKVALAVEGGGMRGVLSAAMMTAIKDRGLGNAFDEIYAVSAGAVNSAYFVAGYGWYGLSIYYDDLTGNDFFDPRRALRHQAPLSLDYVTDVVMESRKPLDFDAALSAKVRLHIAASSVDTITTRDFTEFTSKEQFKTAIRASACLPLVGGPPVAIDGERFFDGGTLLVHPFLLARENGCTHIVVLSTRTSAAFRAAPTSSQRFIAWRLGQLRTGLGDRYLETLKEYGPLRREIKAASDSRTGPPYVLDVACPDGSHRVSRLTRDPGTLFDGIRAGYSAMTQALDGKPHTAYLRPTLFEGLHD
jgi:predicted patatin/cPLA2 family phospholipase